MNMESLNKKTVSLNKSKSPFQETSTLNKGKTCPKLPKSSIENIVDEQETVTNKSKASSQISVSQHGVVKQGGNLKLRHGDECEDKHKGTEGAIASEQQVKDGETGSLSDVDSRKEYKDESVERPHISKEVSTEKPMFQLSSSNKQAPSKGVPFNRFSVSISDRLSSKSDSGRSTPEQGHSSKLNAVDPNLLAEVSKACSAEKQLIISCQDSDSDDDQKAAAMQQKSAAPKQQKLAAMPVGQSPIKKNLLSRPHTSPSQQQQQHLTKSTNNAKKEQEIINYMSPSQRVEYEKLIKTLHQRSVRRKPLRQKGSPAVIGKSSSSLSMDVKGQTSSVKPNQTEPGCPEVKVSESTPSFSGAIGTTTTSSSNITVPSVSLAQSEMRIKSGETFTAKIQADSGASPKTWHKDGKRIVIAETGAVVASGAVKKPEAISYDDALRKQVMSTMLNNLKDKAVPAKKDSAAPVEKGKKETTTRSAGANAEAQSGSSASKRLKDLTPKEVSNKLRRLEEMLSEASSSCASIVDNIKVTAKKQRLLQMKLKFRNKKIRTLQAKILAERETVELVKKHLESSSKELEDMKEKKTEKDEHVRRITKAIETLKSLPGGQKNDNEDNCETCDMELDEGSIETAVPAYVSPLDLGVRKVNPHQLFCHFELNGRCRNEVCNMQHMEPLLLQPPPPPPPPPPVKKREVSPLEAIPLPPEKGIDTAAIPLPPAKNHEEEYQSKIEKSVDLYISNIRFNFAEGQGSGRVSPVQLIPYPPPTKSTCSTHFMFEESSLDNTSDSPPQTITQVPPPPLPHCYSPPPPPPGDSPGSSRVASPERPQEKTVSSEQGDSQVGDDENVDCEAFGVDPYASLLSDRVEVIKRLERILQSSTQTGSDDECQIIAIKKKSRKSKKRHFSKKKSKKKKRKH